MTADVMFVQGRAAASERITPIPADDNPPKVRSTYPFPAVVNGPSIADISISRPVAPSRN